MVVFKKAMIAVTLCLLGSAMALLASSPLHTPPRGSSYISNRLGLRRGALLASSRTGALAEREDVRRAAAVLMGGGGGGGATWDLKLCSPSKINLFLRIVARRPDG